MMGLDKLSEVEQKLSTLDVFKYRKTLWNNIKHGVRCFLAVNLILCLLGIGLLVLAVNVAHNHDQDKSVVAKICRVQILPNKDISVSTTDGPFTLKATAWGRWDIHPADRLKKLQSGKTYTIYYTPDTYGVLPIVGIRNLTDVSPTRLVATGNCGI
jgi:hypothetical protein